MRSFIFIGQFLDWAFCLSLIAALIFGSLWRYHEPLTDRLVKCAATLALITILGLSLWQILKAPFWDRNASRLIGTFAIKYGYSLYCPMGQAPLESINYPPLSALAFTPVVVFWEPTVAILFATLLNILYFFVPFVVLFAENSKESKGKLSLKILIFSLLFFAVYECDPLRYSAFRLHADAPALALAFCSAHFLLNFFQTRRMAPLILSALFSILSIWTKQNMIFLLPAVFSPLLFSTKKNIFVFVGTIAGFGLSSLLVACRFVDLHAMTQHVFFLGSIPMRKDLGNALVSSFIETVRGSMLWLMPCILFTRVAQTRFKGVFEVKTIFNDNSLRPVGLFLWVGLIMLPFSMWSRVKIGGDVNSLSFVFYFWAIAACFSVWHFLAHTPKVEIRKAAQGVAAITVLFFVLLHVPPLVHYGFSSLTARLEKNPQRESYLYIKAHPGRSYFPWNPLSHLLAEGHLYHFDPAVLDWFIAGRQITKKQYEMFIPPNLEYVAFHKDNDFSEKITPRLIADLHQVQPPPIGLSNWIVYCKKQ